ncbi:3TM-type holin [Tropicibacter sp. S64]|uniref:3TM-type holin n=1 Tax=Tropicibacter sp. S64 TaxID=3415122 RepID=UPI003C7BF76D
MGLTAILASLFGGNRNVVREVAEVFKVNAEAADARGNSLDSAALEQFAAEFAARANRTWWDSLVDGLNRLPRPIMALWAIWVLAWTPVNPAFMSEVFAAWAIIPNVVWGVILTIVTFFFGGRNQVKDIDFQREVIGQVATTQAVIARRAELREIAETPETIPDPEPMDDGDPDANAALDAFLATR